MSESINEPVRVTEVKPEGPETDASVLESDIDWWGHSVADLPPIQWGEPMNLVRKQDGTPYF